MIAAVDVGSPAALAGLTPGDILAHADDQPLRDVIDWQWLADNASVTVEVAGEPARRTTLTREASQTWGVTFADTVFDGVRTCRNNCAFCFMTQLPKGLRPALYLRDDDFRLSFLQGNFITLTNLFDADLGRIAEQFLSPLYVSLHAIDRDVRAALVCAQEDRALERFDELLDAGIEMHVQIVLVPGINDGPVLERTLTWLAEREGVLSVGVVPLGYTAHQERFSGSFESAQAARAVIAQVTPWQEAFRKRDGITWLYLADEFYLNAEVDIPPARYYDDFPQYENGIGLVRSFIDDSFELHDQFEDAVLRLQGHPAVTLVSGMLFAPVLERLLAETDPHAHIQVLAVENRFFGGNVSVTGLLVGSDLVPAITEQAQGAIVLVPDVVVNADGLLLDDVPASQLGTLSRKDVRLVSCDAAGLLSALRTAAEVPASNPEE
ncbi:MAG: DUF512 domain-containing protein [Coriobacteriia bacterium]|nr:DUF512 domain-containing protein [Coriobacteriia bacterium]